MATLSKSMGNKLHLEVGNGSKSVVIGVYTMGENVRHEKWILN